MTNYIKPFLYKKEDAKEILSKESFIEIITNTYDFDLILLETDFDIMNFLERIDPEFVTSIVFHKNLRGLVIDICIPTCKINDYWRFKISREGSIIERLFNDETLIAMRKSLSQKTNKI